MKIQSAGFYLLRTPVYSISKIIEFNNSNPSLEEAGAFFSAMLKDKFFLESLYIASPEFYDQLMTWHQKPAPPKDQEKRLLSLYKYYIRMCSRCTPYGLFASCSTGNISDHTAIRLEGLEKSHRNLRLDMNYVSEIVQYLLQIDQVKENSLFYPNTSIYQIADKYRYLEYRIINKQRMYYLTQVTANPYLETILQNATEGVTMQTMAALLCSDEEVTPEEALEFIDQLIQSQLLISKFELMITGEEFFDQLLLKLQTFPEASLWLRPFLMINKLLKAPTPSIRDYLQIGRLLKPILPNTTAKDLIQVDLFSSSSQNEISAAFIDDLTKSFEKLYRIKFLSESTDLQEFRNAFLERYEGREVSLADALDPETGIGYGQTDSNATDNTPLVDDITVVNIPEEKWTWSKMRIFQMKKLFDGAGTQAEEIELTEKDVEELSEPATNIPDSLYIHGSLHKASATGDELNFVLISNQGPSGASLLGRFCHGDKKLSEHVKTYLKTEEQHHPDELYAEIVHLPQSRVGNILMRPFLRSYELVYLGNSSLEADKQLGIDDLVVSVRNGEIMLHSKRLNKRVRPRLTTAHAFGNGNLATYKFLCDLQYQSLMPGVNWSWGPFSSLPCLPRVRYKNIILARRTWVLYRYEFEQKKSKAKDKEQVMEKLTATLQRLKVPRYVLLIEGDNELLLDTTCNLSMRLLQENVLKRMTTTLEEFMNTPEQCIVDGQEGKYVGEFIFPLNKTLPVEKALLQKPVARYKPVACERTFIPGSEWFYLKLYCGTATSEKLLAEIIKPYCENLVKNEVIDSWFFIRYFDPKPHIRVRFHNSATPGFSHAIQQDLFPILDELIKTNLIFNYQIDTYVRELERYSPEAMALSEQLFYHDSVAVVNFIDSIEGQEGETLRWLYALKSIDLLLRDFGCSTTQKLEILSELQHNFYTEFGASHSLKRLLDTKYRLAMKVVAELLNDAPLQFERLAETGELLSIFEQRAINARPVIQQLLAIAAHRDAAYLKDLLFSYIHMFLNRMFLSSQRKHELVLYHYLKKYYTSKIAQEKGKNKDVKESDMEIHK